MKRLILALLIMAWPLSAVAATLTCDSQPGVDSYILDGLGTITTGAANADGSLSVNLDALPAGSYTVKAKACQEVWCSDWSVPFSFVKPALTAPANKRIGR
jgi:hypothetical protein